MGAFPLIVLLPETAFAVIEPRAGSLATEIYIPLADPDPNKTSC